MTSGRRDRDRKDRDKRRSRRRSRKGWSVSDLRRDARVTLPLRPERRVLTASCIFYLSLFLASARPQVSYISFYSRKWRGAHGGSVIRPPAVLRRADPRDAKAWKRHGAIQQAKRHRPGHAGERGVQRRDVYEKCGGSRRRGKI